MERDIVRFGGGHGNQHTTDKGHEDEAYDIMTVFYSDDEEMIKDALAYRDYHILHRDGDKLIIGYVEDNENSLHNRERRYFKLVENPNEGSEVDIEIFEPKGVTIKDNLFWGD